MEKTLQKKKKAKNNEMDLLFDAILSLKTKDECYTFFDDILTKVELSAMAQRIEVAKCLENGLTYNEIMEKTGASSATISRVNRVYSYGNGTYNMVFSRIEDDKKGQ